MNISERLRPDLGSLFAAGAMSLVLVGCHHKSADDFLAEGDAAMQSTKLAEAEKAYEEAVKLAPNDPRSHISRSAICISSSTSRATRRSNS